MVRSTAFGFLRTEYFGLRADETFFPAPFVLRCYLRVLTQEMLLSKSLLYETGRRSLPLSSGLRQSENRFLVW